MRIIISTDFSPEATAAMHYALSAASYYNLRVIVFHFHRLSIHALNARLPNNAIDRVVAKRKVEFENYCEKLTTQYDILVKPHFATGDYLQELEECVAQHKGDLVTLGSGNKSLEQDMLGNTTTRVIGRLKTPAIVIPPNIPAFTPFKKLLFSCDITRGIHAKVLQRVKDFAHTFKAEVEVFHITKAVKQLHDAEYDKHQSLLKEGLSGVTYLYQNVESDKIIETINKRIDAIHADILIMVPYKYGFWNSLVHRSKTKLMASRTKIPLLSIPL